MHGLVYDIFEGVREKNPIWLESVNDISLAFSRMRELAHSRPGPYFIFCAQTHAVIARVDTSAAEEKKLARSA
jgi:hypothetical protein